MWVAASPWEVGSECFFFFNLGNLEQIRGETLEGNAGQIADAMGSIEDLPGMAHISWVLCPLLSDLLASEKAGLVTLRCAGHQKMYLRMW